MLDSFRLRDDSQHWEARLSLFLGILWSLWNGIWAFTLCYHHRSNPMVKEILEKTTQFTPCITEFMSSLFGQSFILVCWNSAWWLPLLWAIVLGSRGIHPMIVTIFLRTRIPVNFKMSSFIFYKRETCFEVVNWTRGTLWVWEAKLNWSSWEQASRLGSCKSCGKLTKWINDYNSAGLSLGSTCQITLIYLSVIKAP